MRSLVRGAYALRFNSFSHLISVSMHSLVRGAYARCSTTRTRCWPCFYALSRARCLCTIGTTKFGGGARSFYALSRARCLCTPSELVAAKREFLCTLSCEVPMHGAENG